MIGDTISAIPAHSAIPPRGQLELRFPLPPLPSAAAIGQIWGGVKRDTLRYMKNIGAIGVAIPYSAIGVVERLGHQVGDSLLPYGKETDARVSTMCVCAC